MNAAVTIIILLVCILLMAVILVQNSKGGGLSSTFSAPNQVMGVKGTADFLEKATWSLIGLLVVLSIASSMLVSTGPDTSSTSEELQGIQEAAEGLPLPAGFQDNSAFPAEGETTE